MTKSSLSDLVHDAILYATRTRAARGIEIVENTSDAFMAFFV